MTGDACAWRLNHLRVFAYSITVIETTRVRRLLTLAEIKQLRPFRPARMVREDGTPIQSSLVSQLHLYEVETTAPAARERRLCS